MALGISIILKTFFVQTFTIPSESMENTLQVGDRIMVNRMVDPQDLRRGDIIVFADPGGWVPQQPPLTGVLGTARKGLEFVGIAPSSQGHVVKRVIGLPGDHVVCCDAQHRLRVNDQPVAEPYLYPGELASQDYFDVTVPAGRLWVMGDHRSKSGDSRFHLPVKNRVPQEHVAKKSQTVPLTTPSEAAEATIAYDLVVGRVFWRMWPLSRIGRVK